MEYRKSCTDIVYQKYFKLSTIKCFWHIQKTIY